MLKITIWLAICCVQQCMGQSKVEEMCKELLPDNYEIYTAPGNNGRPIDILMGFQVLDIDEIDEEKMDYRLHAFVMRFWNDSRLLLNKYKPQGNTMSIIYEKCRHFLWTPDIYFEMAKKIDDFENNVPSTFLKVLPDGALFLSTRYSFKAGCHMNFENYPFDTQNCAFSITLMSSSDSVARLKWIGDTSYGSEIQSIRMFRKPEPLQFFLKKPTTDEVTEQWVEGNYTTLVAHFPMVRRLTGSIVNTFAPSTLIVSMSWVTFWLRTDAVPARVALSITSLLTLCTQVHQYKSQLPPVNYLKAMDIWLFVCIFMVFSTLIVFAFSYNISSRKCESCANKQAMDKTSNLYDCCSRKRKMHPFLENEKQIKLIHSSRHINEVFHNRVCQGCLSNQFLGYRVDEVCRKLFPSIFLIFAITYWVHYLKMYNKTGYYKFK